MINNIPTEIFQLKMNFDISEIHKTSIRILEELGITIRSMQCLDLLKSLGCKIDFKELKAWIPEFLINKALSNNKAPYELFNRPGDHLVIYGGKNILLTSGAVAIRIRDFNGNYRETKSADLEKLTRLHDYFESIDIIHTAVSPSDSPQNALYTRMASLVFKNTSKSCWFVAGDPKTVENIHKMGVAIRGSSENLKSKPFFRIGSSPDSFLGYQKKEAELLMKCAELGIPTGCEYYPIMGLTAPLSISGALAINNANYLCGHLIKKSIDPGNQSVYPVMAGSVNMKNGEVITSSPEIWQYYIAGIKLGQHYGIPTFVLISSDSKNIDTQLIFEKVMGFLISASAGVNNIFGATNYFDSMNMASYEQVIIDLEMLSALANYIKGFEIHDCEKDFEIIKRGLVNKMYFLDDSHTLGNFKKFLWNTEIFTKDNFFTWQQKGMIKVTDRAHKKVEEILSSHFAPELPADVLKELDEIALEAELS